MSRQDDPIAFAEKVIALLDEGSFTSTYKFAVLLGLLEVCMEQSSARGMPPQMVTTPQLAQKVIELYWTHTLPYLSRDARVLRQNTGRPAKILQLIERFRTAHGADATTPSRAASQTPAAFSKLAADVEWSLIQMPLPRLQRLGRDHVPFIYEISWDESVRRRDVRSGDFQNAIRFVGQASQHLVRLAGVLRPLIQRRWAEQVASWNRDVIPDAELEEFLFGRQRINLAPIKRDLYDLQNGRCFYSDERLGQRFDVDHFLPWARYPNNGIENLVLARPSVNNNKRDHLAAAPLVERWVDWQQTHASDLADIASRHLWDRHPAKTLGVARAIYLRLPTSVKLWAGRDHFVDANREHLRAALSPA